MFNRPAPFEPEEVVVNTWDIPLDLAPIAQVKRAHASTLLTSSNVVACGIGFKETAGEWSEEPCVVVSVTKKLPKAQLTAKDLIPPIIDSIRTDVQEVGVFRAWELGTRNRHRPAVPGVSCGHREISAGTLGCLVRRGEQVFILSNNHVLANTNRGRKGDLIIQPGRYDGGTLDDQIASLEEWVPLNTGVQEATCPWAKWIVGLLNALAKATGSDSRVTALRQGPVENQVDCAIARPLSLDLIKPDILGSSVPKGVGIGKLGMQVQKTGRTTGHTVGKITQIDVTVQVDYDGQMVNFVDQFMATGMSTGGDSGSAVLDMEGSVIGLLFAGSELATLINPIQLVLQALQIEIVT